MEITTIIGIIITILIMLYGITLIFKKPAAVEPSLDAALHVNPESQKPVIPRHVRDQLQEQNRVEPSLETSSVVVENLVVREVPSSTQTAKVDAETALPLKDEAVQSSETLNPKTDLAANEAMIEPSESYKAKAAVEHVEELSVEATTVAELEPTKKAEPEFTLNSKVEKAEIADFEEESSILDAHLHEQKRVDEESALATAETVVALNIYPERRLLSGEKTLKVLLKYGLRYGEMQCFHRYNDDGSKLLFSVLQLTKDGFTEGFDLETLSTEEVKGLAFFMALPHSDVQNAFDTMDSIARLIAREVEGTVYDQNNQEFTPQLREYWRHQAIDFRSGQQLGG